MGILLSVERLHTTTFEADEERVAWEGLASSCASPVRRLGAFAILGFVFFVAAITAVILFYNLFGERLIEGQGVPVPPAAFYATLALGAAVSSGGFALWLIRSRRSYRAFSRMLSRGGLDPKRPTRDGLRAYSDEQLLALRSRHERMSSDKKRVLMERIFGFRADDSFALGPLSALPDTFEMNALRVEWESNLILRSAEPMPEISWRDESRMEILPRQLDEVRKLVFILHFTSESVRKLKRSYGYRTDHWHATVPEGKLWNAVRDHEQARRAQAALNRHRARG
ncbi:MAG: hypothetical protein M3494_03785 [Actinomycetota bacterium]|nr:hypothetical protein [Rubrobacter sp.]MDQ3507125.1 hypothetical protein [Actinomycetota bacterium]